MTGAALHRSHAPGGRVLALLLLLLLPSCASTDATVVLVAASLTDVADDLLEAWDGTAVASEGGSQILAAQVRGGAPVDLLLSADPEIARGLAADGLAGDPVAVARNGLAVVTRPGTGIDDPADLARPELRVVLADEAVPLGGYTRQALERLEEAGAAPAGTADAVLARADSFEDDARTVQAKVTAGEADAAVVYRTDAAAARRAGADVTVLAWPAQADVSATYTAQVIDGAPHADAAADLLRLLTSVRAADIWRAHGFDPVGDT